MGKNDKEEKKKSSTGMNVVLIQALLLDCLQVEMCYL